jgi:hypothetical protein
VRIGDREDVRAGRGGRRLRLAEPQVGGRRVVGQPELEVALELLVPVVLVDEVEDDAGAEAVDAHGRLHRAERQLLLVADGEARRVRRESGALPGSDDDVSTLRRGVRARIGSAAEHRIVEG